MKVDNRRHAEEKKKKPRTGAIIGLCVVLVLTIFLGVLGVNGTWLDSRGLYRLLPWLPTGHVENWPKSVELGMDLKGGALVEYEAAMSADMKAKGYNLKTLLNTTVAIIGDRLAEGGYPTATVKRLGVSGIRVQLPEVTDATPVLDLIATPATLTIKDADGNVAMEGNYLLTAAALQDEENNAAVSFSLNEEGTQKFAEVTGNSVGKSITIAVDGVDLIPLSISDPITDGNVTMSGNMTIEQAQTIALKLQGTAPLLDLRLEKLSTVAAATGAGMLGSGVTGAFIGLLLVMALLIFFYRLSGLVASWTLWVFFTVLFLMIAAFSIPLTLPGMAGILLSLLLTVDGHFLALGRVKEEAKAGKPAAEAVQNAFKSVTGKVLTAGSVVLVAGAALLLFDVDAVRGFAIALLLGVGTGLVMTLLHTRFLLFWLASIFPQPALYALAGDAKGAETVKGEAK